MDIRAAPAVIAGYNFIYASGGYYYEAAKDRAIIPSCGHDKKIYNSVISMISYCNIWNTARSEKVKTFLAESWAVSWPMTLIMFFEFLIGLSDVYIAGTFGKEVQAAYGLAFQLYFVFIIAGSALNVGTASLVSRVFTSDNKKALSGTIRSSLMTVGVTGFACSLIGILFAKAFINTFGAPLRVKDLAIPLFTIYAFGFLFDYLLMNTNAVLRACRMIKKSLLTMSVVCLLNIALNFILAFGTPLGYKGIGAATVISLLAGCFLNLSFTKKLVLAAGSFSAAVFKKLITISWPAGILHALWQLGSMALFFIISLLPRHNVEVMAAFTNGLKIESAIFLPAFAFNMANVVVVGNLLGKHRKDDAFLCGIVTAVTGVIFVTLLTALVLLNARSIASLLSHDRIVIEECIRYIFIAVIFEPVMAWGIILAGGLNGAGDTKSVMVMVSASVWLLRIPLCYFLGIVFGFGAVAVWWSMNGSIIILSMLFSRRYFSKRWFAYAEKTAAA